MLLELPPALNISELVKRLKGGSSHFINETLEQDDVPFKWQASYGAFTVSRWDVGRISEYIKKQKEHHGAGTTIELLEEETDGLPV